jgi:hypothetical protein
VQSLSEDSKVHRDSNSQSGSGNSLGGVKVHSLTLFHAPMSMKCDYRPSHLACTFASPCLGHEPKARVVTYTKRFKRKLVGLEGGFNDYFKENDENINCFMSGLNHMFQLCLDIGNL